MKKFQISGIICLSALLLVGCSAEQTGFDIQKVPGRTAVSGKVVYNQGAHLQDGKFVYDYQPASNLDVFVIINNSIYSDSYSGETVLKTVTNENGEYSINVPSPINGGTIEIRTADFEGVHYSVVRENNKIVTVEEQVIYKTEPKTVSISESGLANCNLTCNYVLANEGFDQFSATTAITGTVGCNKEYYKSPERIYNLDPLTGKPTEEVIGYKSASVQYCFEPMPNADLLVTVKYDKYQNGEQKFNCTTDAKGNFTLNVPVVEFPVDLTYTIEVLPVTNAEFVQYSPVEKEFEGPNEGEVSKYIDYERKVLKGWFADCVSEGSTFSSSYAVQGLSFPVDLKVMIFQPLNDQKTYGYSSSNFNPGLPWESELMGNN